MRWVDHFEPLDPVSRSLQRVRTSFSSVFEIPFSNPVRFVFSGYAPSSLSIRAGSSYHAKDGVVHAVKRVIEHEKFNRRNLDYDYALIELVEPLNFTNVIKTVALADSPVADGTPCVVSGWGMNKLKFRHLKYG